MHYDYSMENQTLTAAQHNTLSAQVAVWRFWCAQEDEYFDPADFEINVYQRPSGVVDLFVRCALENPYTTEPSYRLGHTYSNGAWVETTSGADEVPFSYWDNVAPVAVTFA